MVNDKKAWVVSAIMGLGHTRAAYPLRDIAYENIIIEGSQKFCPRSEYKIWHRMRNYYYLMSRNVGISVLGTYVLCALQKIPQYYPIRDLSHPTWAVKYLGALIRKRKLCSTLIEKIKTADLPIINTFYATAIAIDIAGINKKNNYLLICDADINRIWVPENPSKSSIKYLAPCTQVRKRLLSYGVPDENIFLVGFPLPKTNIGSPEKLEILKEDLFKRLLRLDPSGKFLNIREKEVLYFLGKDKVPEKKEDFFVLSFAVGGSGTQSFMGEKILRSLSDKIKSRKIKINLSAGINKEVFEEFHRFIDSLNLKKYLGDGIEIIYDENLYSYMDKFDFMLKNTDVLWTKPSELSFYCALGIPILFAPAVGTHEELNRIWLQEIHAGVKPAGPLEYTHQWLFDLRENGRLAEAAWDGFLKARKLGTYRIEELVSTGKCTSGESPIEM